MVVVDPDQVTILHFTCNGLCEEAVRILVCIPCGLVECDFTGVVMKKWPKNGICWVGFCQPSVLSS